MIVDRRYRAIGGARELMLATEKEVLCASGAGTGKTHSLLRKADYTARKYPGCRQFFARDTRSSMTETVLVEWETAVLWEGHPAIIGSAQRGHRDHYVYPNGSEVIVIGLDNPARALSAQYDRGYIFQAEETNVDQWETLLTRLRNGRTDYHQLVGDVNPSHEFHYLNLRFPPDGVADVMGTDPDTGKPCVVSQRRRVCYLHEDNPRLFDPDTGLATAYGRDYMSTLEGLTGARKERLRYHRWVSESGQIWPDFNPKMHCPYPADVPLLKAYVASMDFGYNAPGCFQVWGIDMEHNAWRIAEVYQRETSMDVWAEGVAKLHEMYPFDVGVGDVDATKSVEFLNRKLKRGQVFTTADKSRGKLYGIDHVRDCLRKMKVRLVKDSAWWIGDDGVLHKGHHPELVRTHTPKCTEEEIPGYVFKKNKDGQDVVERPDPSRPNEGCDAMEYFCVFEFQKDLLPIEKKWAFAPAPRGKLSVADVTGFTELAIEENW